MPNRRTFLQRTARTVAWVAVAPQIVRSGVLPLHGQPGINESIVTGHIGLGPRGRELLPRFKHVAAVCDVDQRRLADVRPHLPETTQAFQDFRRVLERPDIDAVVIATPDHWHALMTVLACRAGKHVYLETPLCRSIHEGARMERVVTETGRCVQIGGQGRSNPLGFAACQLIRSGGLGEIRRIECWHPPDPAFGASPASSPPPGLDWDLWLGPLADRPFDEALFDGRWRFAPGIGGGALVDRGFHMFGLLTWFLDLDLRRLRKVSVTPPKPETADNAFEARFELTGPDLEIIWSQPGTKAGNTEFGATYSGTRDSAVVEGGERGVGGSPNLLPYMAEETVPSVTRSKDQIDNWRDAIRSGSPPIFPVADGCRANTLVRLAGLARRAGGEILLPAGALTSEIPGAILTDDRLDCRSAWTLPV